MPKQGDLRVWWIPQVPGKPFYVNVSSVKEAGFLMDTLARYDAFQYENNIKPDYCNVGGLQEYRPDCIDPDNPEDDGWTTWMDEETGIDNVDEYLEEMKNEEGLHTD